MKYRKHRDPLKTLTELAQTSKQVSTAVESGLSKDWDILERPYPIALHYFRTRLESSTADSGELQRMIGAYYALCIRDQLTAYLNLYSKLISQKYTSSRNRFEVGNDAYLYALPEKKVGPERDLVLEELLEKVGQAGDDDVFLSRVMVLETQSRNHFILLNKTYASWHVHFREFKSRYRRDKPGLRELIKGSTRPGEASAGIGFRYADARDKGYILSFHNKDQLPMVEDAFTTPYHELTYIMLNLDSAACQLEE